MRHIHPLYLFQERGVSAQHTQAVLAGIEELVSLAGVTDQVEIRDFGAWRHERYQDEQEQLVPFHSIDWYIQRGRHFSTRPRQINADQILMEFRGEPWRDVQWHFDVLLLQQDLNSGEDDINFVIGLGLENVGTVISTYRFREVAEPLQSECIKTMAMHEVGHVFGLLPNDRREDVEDSLGAHCTNRCLMRQGLNLPDDWIRFTRDRLAVGPLCERCCHDLQQHFR